jgi:protein-S-isoprenylcysteine O-methyltransferase Ste14
MFTIRIYYQRKVLPERKAETIKGNPLALIPGVIAALTAVIFGLEYILVPGTFRIAYEVSFPDWLRWSGFLFLLVGTSVLWSAHHHLGRSFSSFVAFKQDQSFVNTGPYQYIRHPIYTAYFLNYLGGGLLSANIILTVIPFLGFVLMIVLRIHEEEKMLLDEFGDKYEGYMNKTGRFLPKIF